MKTQHTPGPWHVNQGNHIHNKDEHAIAFCIYGVAHATETEANARLIAAAPELLEALQSCVGSLLYAVDALEAPQDSMMRSNLTFAMQTIKKAKGE